MDFEIKVVVHPCLQTIPSLADSMSGDSTLLLAPGGGKPEVCVWFLTSSCWSRHPPLRTSRMAVPAIPLPTCPLPTGSPLYLWQPQPGSSLTLCTPMWMSRTFYRCAHQPSHALGSTCLSSFLACYHLMRTLHSSNSGLMGIS